MDIFVRTGELLESTELINRPTYVKHNAYGNVKYYPVLEPATIISYPDLKSDKLKEVYSKYTSAEQLAEDFFEWNPEETGGHLNDQKTIHFGGFEYIYHPNHKTHYGNVDRLYFLLPIIARWYFIKSGGYNLEEIAGVQYTLPRDYKGGESLGIHNRFGEEPKKEVTKSESAIGHQFIPMVKGNSVDRYVLYLNTPKELFETLDELLELPHTVGITLNGKSAVDLVEEVEGTNKLCFAVAGDIPNIKDCEIEVIASKDGVSLCQVTTSLTKAELNEIIAGGYYQL